MTSIRTQGPAYVPAGYELSQRLDGSEAPALGPSTELALMYRAGNSKEDWRNPLQVYIATSDAATLAATENQPGSQVEMGIADVEAVYHDGWWVLGPGDQEQRFSHTSFCTGTRLRSTP